MRKTTILFFILFVMAANAMAAEDLSKVAETRSDLKDTVKTTESIVVTAGDSYLDMKTALTTYIITKFDDPKACTTCYLTPTGNISCVKKWFFQCW